MRQITVRIRLTGLPIMLPYNLHFAFGSGQDADAGYAVLVAINAQESPHFDPQKDIINA